MTAYVQSIAHGDTLTVSVAPDPVVPPPVVVPPDPPPVVPGQKVVTVDASWSAILAAVADITVDRILVRDGTIGSISLSKGNAARPSTKPVAIAAVNKGAVKVSGWSGEGIHIDDGACYFSLSGFAFRNANAAQGGCIVFGASGSNGVDCHHIDLDDMDIDPTVTGPSAHGSTNNATAWGLYFGDAYGTGHHNINARRWTARAGHKGLAGAIQFYHSTPSTQNYNAHDVLIDGWVIDGFEQSVMVWDDTIRNITISNTTITDSGVYAVRQQYGAFTLDHVTSTGSGSAGLSAASPSRVTQIACSLK